ncbi:MAG: glycosyltransferase family 4 protein [Anaerolineales bacterium]|nr:glycosyltransferase family 4 protein [Anaerolineales bacterium]
MRIAIDMRDLQIARTGNRTYLEEVSRALVEVAPEHEFIFLSPAKQLAKAETAVQKIKGHIAFYLWKEITLPWLAWREQCHVIFCTDYVVPLFTTAHTVPVFHDASFWERPQNYNRFWRWLLNLLALPAARKSAAVVTVSESARQHIHQYTHIPLEKLVVIYEAPKQVAITPLSLSQKTAILDRYGLTPDTPFILHVGVIEKRKNLARLVTAFAQARLQLGPAFRLVLVGQPGPKKDLDDSQAIRQVIQDLDLGESVILAGHVSDVDLPAFYQAASFYTLPSLYEGFGLPVLEAFANNLPLMAANTTSLPEIAGDAALYFDPESSAEMAAAMVRIATDAELRASLIDKGKQRLKIFSWEKTARQIMQLFIQLEDRL